MPSRSDNKKPSRRTTKLRYVGRGVYFGTIDIRTPCGEEFFKVPDHAEIMEALVEKKKASHEPKN